MNPCRRDRASSALRGKAEEYFSLDYVKGKEDRTKGKKREVPGSRRWQQIPYLSRCKRLGKKRKSDIKISSVLDLVTFFNKASITL
ncbi:hypothetical protein AOLI_G00285000 [Acnodon oligacanthus]